MSSKQEPNVRLNIVKGKVPKHGSTPAGYFIYADKGLSQKIATLPNTGKKTFKFAEIAPFGLTQYYIVSYAPNGSISKAAVAKIKKKK